MNLTPVSREYYQCFQKHVPNPAPLVLSTSSKNLLKSVYKNLHVRRPSSLTGESDEPVLAELQRDSWYTTIPKEVREEIAKMAYTKTYTLKIGERNIRVVMVRKTRSLDFCQKAIKKIERWLSFVLSIAPAKCANSLSIYLCFTDKKKVLPGKTGALYNGGDNTSHNGGDNTSHNGGDNTSHNGGDNTSHNGGDDTSHKNVTFQTESPLVDQIHANTAFTTSCSHTNSIFIYRKEEWFKVLLHESFHCLGLDFSGIGTQESNQMILSQFPGLSPSVDVRLYETYCEMWAEIINLLFLCGPSTIRCKSAKYTPPLSKRRSQKGVSRDVGFHCVVRLLQYERVYSVFQAGKLLRHYGLKYTDLFEPTHSYREKTQAFSYYVLKSILMWNIDAFLQWCLANNPTPYSLEFAKSKVAEYAGLIESKSRDASYMDAVSKEIGVEKCGRGLGKTMRMCLFESG
jgi:hypothetical protein